MFTDNKEACFKYTSRYLFDQVYNSVHKEFRSNIRLTKLTERSVNNIFATKFMSVTLPDVPNSRWEVYSCSHIHLNNVLQNQFDWISLEDVCNSENIVIDVHDNNGLMMMKSSVYIKMSWTGYYVLAIRKQDIDRLEVGSDMYINLYVDSSLPDDVTIISHNPLYSNNYAAIQNAYAAVADFTKYKIFINGYMIEPNKFNSTVAIDKYIEFIHDENIVLNNVVDLDPRETYNSTTEALEKDVVYVTDMDDSFVSYNNLEVYIVSETRGVLLPFNSDQSVSQLTNNFWAITSSLIDNCKTFLDDGPVHMRIVRKKFDDRAELIDNGYLLETLEVFSDEEKEKLISDEHLPNLAVWKGDSLEQHPFNDYLFDNILYDEYTTANVKKQIQALGYYNFIGCIANLNGSLDVQTTTINALTIPKQIAFRDVDVFPLIFVNGVKIPHILYNTFNDSTYVQAVFSEPYVIPSNADVRYKLVEQETAYCELFTPTAGSYSVSIPNDGPIVLYVKEAIETYGPNGPLGYGFTELQPGSSLVTITSDPTTYTISFDPAVFDKDVHIFYTNKRFVVNEFTVNADDGDTFAVQPYFVARNSLEHLPIKYSDSFEVYLNGKYLIPGLDFTVHRAVCDDEDMIGEFFVTVHNMNYMVHGDNLIELYGTDHQVIRSDTSFVVDNKIPMTQGNFLGNEYVTVVNINGIRSSVDVLHRNKGYYDITAANGAVVSITTSVPRNLMNVYSSDEYVDFEDEVTEVVDYLISLNTTELPETIVVPSTHNVYSSYLNTIIDMFIDGTISIPFANDIDDLLIQLQDWDYLKKFDVAFQDTSSIVFDDNGTWNDDDVWNDGVILFENAGFDNRFVDLYPGYLADKFTTDMGVRLTVDRLMNYYLNNDHTHGGHVVFRDSELVGQPNITSPVDGAVDVSVIPVITGSEFKIEDRFYGTHTGTNWQIATDTQFTNIVFERQNDLTHLETLQVNIPLSTSTTYYVRCQYLASTLSSRWSEMIHFTTED